MTRLSDALKRAQETAGAPPLVQEEALPPGPAPTWKFAPVETMRAIEQKNEKWKEQTEAPR